MDLQAVGWRGMDCVALD